jgi:alpha-tubulin suppressor-like RCC1 family protein
MSVTKNVFRLNEVYDLVNSRQWIDYDNRFDAGELWAWGFNADGQLGDNTILHRSSPVQIPGTQWNNIAGGGHHSLARKTDGTLWSWGRNTQNYGASGGQLGDNTALHRSSPVQIPGTQWNDVAAGCSHSLARKTDGTLWSWGRNANGRLGDNTIISQSSPVQIPGTQWNDVAAGNNHSLARKTDGTLWSWGYNRCGELGISIRDHRSSPVQVTGTQWSDVTAGRYHSLARKTDGTLWSWGRNISGQLGNNCSIYERDTPTEVFGSGTQWNDIAGGGEHSLARKTDGTLWVWGNATQGQLGAGTNTVHRSVPVQIPGTQWNDIAGGANHSLARKTNGTLWSWGYNGQGRLGDNTTVHRSSPVQIPGTQWNDVAGTAIGGHTLARKLV